MPLRKLLIWVCLAASLGLAGCATGIKGGEPSSASNDAPAAQSKSAPAQTTVTQSRDLFPRSDLQLTFAFQDKTQSRELLLPDGDRLVQTYNGEPYITWFFGPDGVYRPDNLDPAHKGLLRFLPAQLQDGVAWDQHTVSGSYHYRLTHPGRCSGDQAGEADCWKLEVINRQGVTTYYLAAGLGVVQAQADYYEVAGSFAKGLQTRAAAPITPQDRQALLGRGLTLAQMHPPEAREITKRDPSAFQENLDWANSRSRCGQPTDGKPVLPGAAGRVTALCADKLWSEELATGKQAVLLTHEPGIWDFAWEPNGRGIAFVSGLRNDTFYWDAATGKIQPMAAGSGDPIELFWSTDGAILVVSPGTSNVRGFTFIDRLTGQKLGSSHGTRITWSPVTHRYATMQGLTGAASPGMNGASLVVGDLADGRLTEVVVAPGDKENGYRPVYWAADGTLVYLQEVPYEKKPIAFWALPPAPGAQPVKLDPDSPLAKEGRARSDERRPLVNGRQAHMLDNSPDGKWALFLYSSYDEIYLIASSASGPSVRLPGSSHQWDPRVR